MTSAAVPVGSPRDRAQLTSERVQTEIYPLATFDLDRTMQLIE